MYIPRNAGTAPAKTAMACRLVMDIYPPLVALFPGSHFLPGCSQAIDSQCHDISLSQICWGPHSQADPCRSASTDDVTQEKYYKLAHIAEERRYVKTISTVLLLCLNSPFTVSHIPSRPESGTSSLVARKGPSGSASGITFAFAIAKCVLRFAA